MLRPTALVTAEAFLIAAGVRLALRLLSFRRVVAFVAGLPAARTIRRHDVPVCVAAARRAAARVAHPTCLFESIIALALLRRRGHDATFHLGARRGAGFEAHAWLTVGGLPVDGAGDDAYVCLWRFPLGAAS